MSGPLREQYYTPLGLHFQAGGQRSGPGPGPRHRDEHLGQVEHKPPPYLLPSFLTTRVVNPDPVGSGTFLPSYGIFCFGSGSGKNEIEIEIAISSR